MTEKEIKVIIDRDCYLKSEEVRYTKLLREKKKEIKMLLLKLAN